METKYLPLALPRQPRKRSEERWVTLQQNLLSNVQVEDSFVLKREQVLSHMLLPVSRQWEDGMRIEMFYIYTTKYYSMIRKNTTTNFTGKLMELETTIPSGMTQAQRDKCCMCSLICRCQL